MVTKRPNDDRGVVAGSRPRQRAKVVVLQHRLLHYRVQLFEDIRSCCAERNIDFCLVHGQPTPTESQKADTGHIAWADVVTNRVVTVLDKDLLWQPFPRHHRDADLVLVMQENRLLSNYPWLFGLRGPRSKIAYWGHGRNLQSDRPSGWRERWKRQLVGRVDWWFAYTEQTRDILLADGYPDERITVLENAIDNEEFERLLAAVPLTRLDELLQEISSDGSSPVGLYCGSLYPDKRLDYMIAAADIIHAAIPEFRLVVIGHGPSAALIEVAALTRPWLKWVGPLKGAEKAAWFRLADLIINPGAVGLHVLDAFCSGSPMVTTRESRHGPEVAYLDPDVNGLVVSGDPSAYASEVIALLGDPPRLDSIRLAALNQAARYTLGNMVQRFVAGIEHCLSMPGR